MSDGLSSGDALGAPYERCVEAAREYLCAPLSVTVSTWEDGEIEVRAAHGIGPFERDGTQYREVVRYHTGEDSLQLAVFRRRNGLNADLLYRRTLTDDGRQPAGARTE